MHSERTSAATSADSTITASVSRRLVADSQLGRYEFKVETLNGRVTLRGTVDTYAARERAASLTREATGVVSVNNRVAVHQESAR
jgi:osmotically-inducible protein OsmY